MRKVMVMCLVGIVGVLVSGVLTAQPPEGDYGSVLLFGKPIGVEQCDPPSCFFHPIYGDYSKVEFLVGQFPDSPEDLVTIICPQALRPECEAMFPAPTFIAVSARLDATYSEEGLFGAPQSTIVFQSVVR